MARIARRHLCDRRRSCWINPARIYRGTNLTAFAPDLQRVPLTNDQTSRDRRRRTQGHRCPGVAPLQHQLGSIELKIRAVAIARTIGHAITIRRTASRIDLARIKHQLKIADTRAQRRPTTIRIIATALTQYPAVRGIHHLHLATAQRAPRRQRAVLEIVEEHCRSRVGHRQAQCLVRGCPDVVCHLHRHTEHARLVWRAAQAAIARQRHTSRQCTTNHAPAIRWRPATRRQRRAIRRTHRTVRQHCRINVEWHHAIDEQQIAAGRRIATRVDHLHGKVARTSTGGRTGDLPGRRVETKAKRQLAGQQTPGQRRLRTTGRERHTVWIARRTARQARGVDRDQTGCLQKLETHRISDQGRTRIIRIRDLDVVGAVSSQPENTQRVPFATTRPLVDVRHR